MKRLNPKQKRVLEIAGVAGLVLLVVMLAKRQNAGAAVDTGATGVATPDPSAAGGSPADFSGDQSGNLSDIANTWSGALGDLGTGVSQLGSNQAELASGEQSISDSLVTLGGSLAETQAGVDALTNQLQAGPFATATAGTPSSVTRKATSVPKTQTIVKASAKHHGELSVYHVTPGHAPVYVRGASAAAKAKAKPAKKTTVHKAAPKKPAPAHRSPSQKPKAAPRAPARKKAHR